MELTIDDLKGAVEGYPLRIVQEAYDEMKRQYPDSCIDTLQEYGVVGSISWRKAEAGKEYWEGIHTKYTRLKESVNRIELEVLHCLYSEYDWVLYTQGVAQLTGIPIHIVKGVLNKLKDEGKVELTTPISPSGGYLGKGYIITKKGKACI